MISDAPLYLYEDISKRWETRLITLQPGAWDDPIAINLKKINLRQAKTPSFEALSYHWGNPKKTDEVKVEEGGITAGVIHVTENLYLALRYLRKGEEKPRNLWIDAICINQGNTREKNIQVGRMGHLFQNAWKVVVFLGKPDHQHSLGMDLLVKYGNSVDFDEDETAFELKQTHMDLFITGTTEPKLSADETCAIESVMSRAWFRRIWVIQEVVLMRNRTESIVQCGDKIVSWENFRQGYLVMTDNLPGESSQSESQFPALTSIPESAQLLCNPFWGVDIVDVFWGFQEFKCSVPLDRFYGVLGLLNKATSRRGKSKKVKYDIRVEYEQSVEELFEEVQRWEIETTGLHLLRFCDLESQDMCTKLAGQRPKPSWVPVPKRHPSFLAVPRVNPMIRFRSKHCFHENGILEVYGQSIGSVLQTYDCQKLANDWFNGASLASVLNELHHLCSKENFGMQNHGLEAALMAIMDVLNGHIYKQSSPAFENADRNVARGLISTFCGRKRLDEGSIPEIDDQAQKQAAALLKGKLDDIFRTPTVLYVTDKGDIGLGTGATTTGDIVCAIYGAEQFMILRPVDKYHHRVVGPTCVDSQRLAEAILGPVENERDDTWVVFDIKKKKNVLKTKGKNAKDTRVSDLGGGLCFKPSQLDIDSNQTPLAEKLRKYRKSFLLI